MDDLCTRTMQLKPATPYQLFARLGYVTCHSRKSEYMFPCYVRYTHAPLRMSIHESQLLMYKLIQHNFLLGVSGLGACGHCCFNIGHIRKSGGSSFTDWIPCLY